MEPVANMDVEGIDVRAEPFLVSLPYRPQRTEVALPAASPLPSGMSEATSNVSQITGRTYVPGASVDVLYVKKIEDLQPCCLAFCPTFRHHFVVGTYGLENPATQSRNGSLLLYTVQDDKLLPLDTYVHSSGILDIKFNNPKCQYEKFAVASSTGSISVFKIERSLASLSDDIKGKIVHLNTFQVFPESVVVTSIAWHSSVNGPIAVTSSDGKVSILNFRDDYTDLHQTAVVNNHCNNEAWMVAFAIDADCLPTGVDGSAAMMVKTWSQANQFERFLSGHQAVFSGGDDSRLRFAMFSRNSAGHTVPSQESTDRYGGGKGLGGHNAGVTAILPLPLLTSMGNDILITGSYDDHVRVYAMYDHSPYATDTKPRVLAELNLGGGVWRLTFLEDYAGKDTYGRFVHIKGPTEPVTFKLLASCMQDGVRILEVIGCLKGEWTIKVIADLRFNTGNDLVYGGDIQPAGNYRSSYHEEQFLFVSANFYAQQLCLWKYTKLASLSSLPAQTRLENIYHRNREVEFGRDREVEAESVKAAAHRWLNG